MVHPIEAHDRQIEALGLKLDQLTDSVNKLVGVTNEEADMIRTLARIAEAHEARIAGLEDRT